MKNLTPFYFTLLSLIFSTVSFAQLDKTTCEAMFNELDVKTYQKIRVVTNVVGTDKAFHNSVYLDNSSIEIIFKEAYVVMKDGSGVFFLIPYDKIKTIKATAETSDAFSSILVYLVD